MSIARAIALCLAVALCGVLSAAAAAEPLPEGADCGSFNGWVSGYGRVTQVNRRQMTVRWEIAADGTLFLGRHTIRLVAGCHYWKITGHPLSESAPVDVVLRTPNPSVFVGGVRPRAGQIISFLAWRLTSPLPAGFARAQVRKIFASSAATSGAAFTG